MFIERQLFFQLFVRLLYWKVQFGMCFENLAAFFFCILIFFLAKNEEKKLKIEAKKWCEISWSTAKFLPFFCLLRKKVPKFRGVLQNFYPFFACRTKKCLNFAVRHEIFGAKWQQNSSRLASHNQLFRYSGACGDDVNCAHLYSEFFRHFSDIHKRGQIWVESVSIA